MGGVVEGIATCNYHKVITDTYTSPLWGFLIVIRTVILIFFRGPQGKGYGTRFCFSSKPTYSSFHRMSPTAFHRSCMLNSNFQPPSLILTPKMQHAENSMISASNPSSHHDHERFSEHALPTCQCTTSKVRMASLAFHWIVAGGNGEATVSRNGGLDIVFRWSLPRISPLV